MDLSTIKPSSLKVDLLHPATGEEIGLTLDVISRDDPTVKRVQRRLTDKRIKRGFKKVSAEQIDEENIEVLSAAVTGWTWGKDASWGGKKLDCNPENVKIILAQPWFRKQVEEAIGEDADFFSAAE
ncbi:MAG TPA: hypothetical protein VGN98_16100 [Tianweitania sediminis]|jgi:hypothetical protein|nr:hypothetical protein [Tianweitania sediminis]